MTALRAVAALLLLAPLISGCADQQETADPQQAGQASGLTPDQEFTILTETLGNTTLPPEVRAFAATLLPELDPARSVAPLVGMLAAEEPLVLVAVIQSLPQAAEGDATAELELLSSSHPVAEVQAASRARLAEFKAFHQ